MGIVAFILPSVTYAPYRPSLITISNLVFVLIPSSLITLGPDFLGDSAISSKARSYVKSKILSGAATLRDILPHLI